MHRELEAIRYLPEDQRLHMRTVPFIVFMPDLRTAMEAKEAL